MNSAGRKSKTFAAWLAVVGGALGLHRMYLHGFTNLWAWGHVVPTLVGYVGVLRMRDLGQDDRLAWALIPVLGLMIAQGMLHAIVYGLMSDERWDQRYNHGQIGPGTGWGPVLAVITALLVGATVLMGTIAFGGQKFFEWQLEDTNTTPGASQVLRQSIASALVDARKGQGANHGHLLPLRAHQPRRERTQAG